MIYYHVFKKLLSSYYKKFADEKYNNRLIELNQIETTFNLEKYEYIMNLIYDNNMNYKRKNLITHDAYLLSIKIKEQLNIEVFPIIIPLYINSSAKSQGYATWKMYSIDEFVPNDIRIVAGADYIKDLVKKKNNIFIVDNYSSYQNIYVSM